MAVLFACPRRLECRSCRYVGCSGARDIAWVADSVAICVSPASSVTVSVIVLGLTGWLVTCFFGCSGARDALWLCFLRVPGALNADLVAMLGAPGLVTSLGWLILLLFACPR